MLNRRGVLAGYAVTYREFEGPHTVPEAIAQQGFTWFARR